MLITFEGIDGCGKSSQAKLTADRLNDQGIECLLVREPGGAELSEQIRGILLDTNHTAPVSHCLLYTSPSPRDRQKSRMPSSA